MRALRAAALLAGCAAWATGAAAQDGRMPAPTVDHHQHLLSPATAKAWSDSGLAPVPLPAELAPLLAARDRAFGDSAGLAPLYAEDAVVLTSLRGTNAYSRGRAASAAALAALFARPYRVTPVEVRIDGASARLAGYLTRGEGAAAAHFGHILLALRRGDAGWLIEQETLAFPGPEVLRVLEADELIALLDEARIQRALVLSSAYLYGAPDQQPANEAQMARADNEWTAAQTARYPDRLFAFCGIAPLRPWALDEIARCDADPRVTGLKLHFGNSRVDLRDPAHLARVRAVFRAANQRRMPIVAHLRTWEIPYGAEFSQLFLDSVLPFAPDIPIQVAHMTGSGPGWEDPPSDSALAVFAQAAQAGDPRMRRLWFDLATVVNQGISAGTAQRLADRIRALGVERVVYGSDLAIGSSANLPPRQGWAAVMGLLPLAEAELRTIATNVFPFRLDGASPD
jgi:predicted TIM-barrel fold metal-dependent hydrolase